MENLLSGALGAAFILLIQLVYNQVLHANRLYSIRKTVYTYLNQVVKPYIEIYSQDVIEAINRINEDPNNPRDNKYEFEDMPLLNSDLFKTQKPEVLFKMCNGNNSYVRLIELAYTIEFLKSKMPVTFCNDFFTFVDRHIESKNLKTKSEILEHISDCPQINQRKEFDTSTLRLRLKTTSHTNLLMRTLLSELKYSPSVWFCYFFGRIPKIDV